MSIHDEIGLECPYYDGMKTGVPAPQGEDVAVEFFPVYRIQMNSYVYD